nr:sulfite exporter TauE/SafE family protein [Clostridium paraputrificum]
MSLILFSVSLISSLIGAISGIGGGVIIKPVLDSLGVMSISTINFLSGCTVLAMAITSLIRSKLSGKSEGINYSITVYLAVGSALGGLLGKWIFNIIKSSVSSESIIGLIQSIILLLINIVIIIYMKNKNKVTTLKIENKLICILIGLVLGVVSSFLGIGGGPLNIAVLYFFLSMSAKETAINSIFIILFSQVTSLSSTVITGSIPEFANMHLMLMCMGGIGGALLGSRLSKKMDDNKIEKFFLIVLFILSFINIINLVKFL